MLHALNFFLPINRYLINQYSSASEKAADDSAINFSREPLELASALVKLSKSKLMDTLSPSAAFAKEQNIVEDRISRLLETHRLLPYLGKTHLYLSCIASVFIAATICLSLFSKSFNHIHTLLSVKQGRVTWLSADNRIFNMNRNTLKNIFIPSTTLCIFLAPSF